MLGKRIVVPAAIVAAVAAGGIGGAVLGIPGLSGAQESPSTTAPANADHHFFDKAGPGSELAAAASALHLSTDDLMSKLSDGKTTIADIAAQQHVDVNTVIDAMAGADRSRIEQMVNNPWPFGPHDGRRGFGRFHFVKPSLDAAAKALGISTTDLDNDLHNGQSIAAVAKSKAVDLGTVIDAMVADASARIDQAVKDGDLSQQAGDDMKSHLKDEITSFVNGSMPRFGRDHGGPPGMPFGGPMPPGPAGL